MFGGDDPKPYMPKGSRAQKSRTWIILGGIAASVILLFVHRTTNSTDRTLHGTSPKVRDFSAVCNAYATEEPGIAQRIIMQTNPVAISQRRLLHTHLSTVPVVLDGGPSCMAFKDVPRIAHPRPPKTAPNAMFFSLATKAARIAFDDSICAHWLNNSNTHLLLKLPHDDDPAAEYVAEAFLNKLGLASYHISRAAEGTSYEESWAEAYPRMLEIATTKNYKVDYYSKLRFCTRNLGYTRLTQVVAMDDDTLITSLTNYRHMLDDWDPDKQVFIGAPSEDLKRFHWGVGLSAYGGASIILSRQLVKDIAAVWEECRYMRDTAKDGDRKLQYAVAYVQGRPVRFGGMYHEPGLHQIDLRGFAGALFSSGQRWLTIHHLAWVDLFPTWLQRADKYEIDLIEEVSDKLDGENLFQNYLLSQNENESIIMTNGYSITMYRPPLQSGHLGFLEQQEQQVTGPGDWHELEATQGPYRPLREEGKDKWTA